MHKATREGDFANFFFFFKSGRNFCRLWGGGGMETNPSTVSCDSIQDFNLFGSEVANN